MAWVRPRLPTLCRSREKQKWWAEAGMDTLGAETLTEEASGSGWGWTRGSADHTGIRINRAYTMTQINFDLCYNNGSWLNKLELFSCCVLPFSRWSSSKRLSASLSVWVEAGGGGWPGLRMGDRPGAFGPDGPEGLTGTTASDGALSTSLVPKVWRQWIQKEWSNPQK